MVQTFQKIDKILDGIIGPIDDTPKGRRRKRIISNSGWHKDKPQFGVIVGVSLLAPATMRFRRAEGRGGFGGLKDSSRDRFTSWRVRREPHGSIVFRQWKPCGIP